MHTYPLVRRQLLYWSWDFFGKEKGLLPFHRGFKWNQFTRELTTLWWVKEKRLGVKTIRLNQFLLFEIFETKTTKSHCQLCSIEYVTSYQHMLIHQRMPFYQHMPIHLQMPFYQHMPIHQQMPFYHHMPIHHNKCHPIRICQFINKCHSTALDFAGSGLDRQISQTTPTLKHLLSNKDISTNLYSHQYNHRHMS